MNPKINVIWTSTCPASDLGGIDLLESTAANLFLTGHAGSGKTTFVRHWRAITGETVAVLAPTGIARRFRVLAASARRSHATASATTERRGVTGPRQHGAGRHDSIRAYRSGVCDGRLQLIMASTLTFCFAGLQPIRKPALVDARPRGWGLSGRPQRPMPRWASTGPTLRGDTPATTQFLGALSCDSDSACLPLGPLRGARGGVS
jgi:energy-coupling factor transporter ATP-binding protein EcfA2